MKHVAIMLLYLAMASDVRGAILLDFESFRVEDALLHDHPGILDMNGFRLTSMPPPGNAFRFSTVGTQHPLFPGSTALFNGQSNAEIVLTAIDGSPFTLLSIDLAVLPPGANDPAGPFDPGPFDITFLGSKADATIVSETFTINHTFLTFEGFTFAGFDNVVSVRWLQGSGFNPPGPPQPIETPTHQFDNILIKAVPEPPSFRVFVGILLSFGFLGWHGRAKAAPFRSFTRQRTSALADISEFGCRLLGRIRCSDEPNHVVLRVVDSATGEFGQERAMPYPLFVVVVTLLHGRTPWKGRVTTPKGLSKVEWHRESKRFARIVSVERLPSRMTEGPVRRDRATAGLVGVDDV